MDSKYVLSYDQMSILAELYQKMFTSINNSVYASSETLTIYTLARTFSPIRTIKSICGDIIEKHRTTVTKYIQELSKACNFPFNQFKALPGILDGRESIIGILDSTLLKRFSERVYSAKNRWNYIKRSYEILQEQINCCIHTGKGVYTALTIIKPPNKKSTGIYSEMIDELSKKTSGR